MVMIPPISGPNVQSSASRDSQGQDARVVVKQSLATTMPSDRQTSIGILNVEANKASTGDYDQWKRSRVFNPKQAGIAIIDVFCVRSLPNHSKLSSWVIIHPLGAEGLAFERRPKTIALNSFVHFSGEYSIVLVASNADPNKPFNFLGFRVASNFNRLKTSFLC